MRNEQPEEVPRGSSATQQGSKSRLRPTAIMSRRSHSFRLRAVRGFEEVVSDTRKHHHEPSALQKCFFCICEGRLCLEYFCNKKKNLVCDCTVQAVGGRALSALSTTRGTSLKPGYVNTHSPHSHVHVSGKKKTLFFLFLFFFLNEKQVVRINPAATLCRSLTENP